MKQKNKLAILLTTFLMVLSVILPSTSVFALPTPQEIKTTVYIHKLQADSYAGNVPTPNNNGDEIKDLSSLGSNVKPLEGVTFTPYRISDYSVEGLKAPLKALGKTDADFEGKSVNALYEMLRTELEKDAKKSLTDQQATMTTIGAEEKQALTPTGPVDGHDGTAKWEVAEKDYGVYWVLETDKPETVSSAVAVPFLIAFPLYTNVSGQTGEQLNTAHVYPKNVTGDLPEVDKDVDELRNKDQSFDVGDDVPWIISAEIPHNLKEYTSFELVDNIDTRLTYNQDSVKVYYETATDIDNKETLLGKTEVNADFIEVIQPAAGQAGGTLTVKLTADGITQLNAAGAKDKKLYVYFTTKINETAEMGQDIENDVTLEFDNGSGTKTEKHPNEKPKTWTGGRRFKKVDTDETTKTLEGAEFVITKDEQGTEYLAVSQAAGWTWTTVKDDAATFTSAADGTFEVKGLKGARSQDVAQDENKKVTYWLHETKAPEGYVLLEKPMKFEITEKSYDEEPSDLNLQKPGEVGNVKRPNIPNTGGMGSAIFIAIGLGLMVVAYMKLKPSKEA